MVLWGRKGGVNGTRAAGPAPPRFLRRHHANCPQFPNLVMRAAQTSYSLRAFPPPPPPAPSPQPPAPDSKVSRAGSLTRDIQRPSPCTSCTGVGLLAGFSSPLILAPRLQQDERARSAGECSRRRRRRHAHPYPSGNNGLSRSPHSSGGRGRSRAPPPLRGGNLHLEELLPPRRPRSGLVRRFLPGPLTLRQRRRHGAWGEARPSSTRGGEERETTLP